MCCLKTSALQQILYNAVLHRIYENTHAPAQIFWFNDRIEIRSPGGPYGNVTSDNFGQPGAVDYRNPNIADVLKTVGFIQAFGRGIAVARSAMKENGNLYRPMRLLAAFGQLMRRAAHELRADMVLADTGPNLGAINRSVLLASDYVAIVLGADFFSLRGLSGLGPALKHWKALWQQRLENWRAGPQESQYPDFRPRAADMQPIGYLCRQHGVRLDRPITADDRWVNKIPGVYRQAILDEAPVAGMTQNNDPYCLAIMKPYRSLLPIAEERRKPIFKLTSADGAIGSHAGAVADAKKEFRQLAAKIAIQMGIEG